MRAAHRPYAFDGDHRSDFRPPPAVGEHTMEGMKEIGLTEIEIERLTAQGLAA